MQLLSSILLCTLLAGCCAPMPKPPNIDSYLMTECTGLSNSVKFASFEDVLAEKAKDNLLFAECSKKHSGLISTINKYKEEFNAVK